MNLVGEKKQYQIDTNSIIGSGSYGKVFSCQDKSGFYQGQLCAKVTNIYKDNKKEQANKEIDREKQITEIVQNNKTNPNLVQVYYVEHNKEKSCLVVIMEKCISNLDQEWKMKNIYPEHEVINFLSQFLNGYRALYNSNVIHRDIKPENILIQQIDNQKYYRLADFGIGRVYKLNDFKFTKIGTPIFASPELNSIIQDDDLDKKFALMKKEKQKSVVDIYSLGILLHLLVTGGYPCDTNSQKIKEFLYTIKIQPFRMNVPNNTKLINIIERMIVYDPSQRMTFDQLFEEVLRLTYGKIPFNLIPNLKPNYQPVINKQINPIQNPYPTPQVGPFIQNFPINNQIFQPNVAQPFQQNFQQPNQKNLNFALTNQININNEITCQLKKILQMHKNVLNPQSQKIFVEFLTGDRQLSDIGQLYNNFDKNIQYSEEEMLFYYCLKQGLKGNQNVPKVSYEDQKKDLSN